MKRKKRDTLKRIATKDNGAHFIGESHLSMYFSSNSEKSVK